MKRLWLEANAHIHKIEEYILMETAATPAADLTVKQLHILDALYRNNHVHAKEVARAVNQSETTFTPVLDGLMAKGLITRSPDPDDRRAVFIDLTDEARALEDTVCDVLGKAQRAF